MPGETPVHSIAKLQAPVNKSSLGHAADQSCSVTCHAIWYRLYSARVTFKRDSSNAQIPADGDSHFSRRIGDDFPFETSVLGVKQFGCRWQVAEGDNIGASKRKRLFWDLEVGLKVF